MGSCYSGLGSKSCPQSLSSTQSPIDRNNKQIISENNVEIKNKSKTNKLRNSTQLSSSFEDITYTKVSDKKQFKPSMSSMSTNRQKIPISSSKLSAHNRVVPTKGSQELAHKQWQQNDGSKYGPGLEVNQRIKGMPCDHSSTTSISSGSGSSVNLSKSSFKSSTSSANSSIPKPKSRTPTPPMAVKYASNIRSRNVCQQRYSDNKNKLTLNNSSLITDRLNGNRIQTTTQFKANQTTNKANTNTNVSLNSVNSESKASKSFASNVGIGVKLKTQLSGLPRPQTAHIVSTTTTSHNDNTVNHLNDSSDIQTRSLQYSSETKQHIKCDPNVKQHIKCDPNLRQVNKPVNCYYYGMNKPYNRPNINNNCNTNSNINYNINRLHSFNPTVSSGNNSHQIWAKPNNITGNSIPSLTSTKVVTDYHSIESQLTANKRKVKPELRDQNIGKNMNESDIFPKSVQQIKDMVPVFIRKDSNITKNISETNNRKSALNSPQHNSIGSASGNETENRDFLIDDEISDQPELVLNSAIDKNDLVMKSLHSELEGLLLKQESSLSPSLPSSPTVSLSNSSSTTLTPNSTTFRKPRPLSLVEMPDGSFGLDSPSFRAACQDLIGIKTLLFRLHGILQNAETLNPFDYNYSQNKFYQQLLVEENDGIKSKSNDLNAFQQENLDLKRQIVLMQQQMEDKDRTIRLLQQQMAKYSNINNAFVSQNIKQEKVNASSQTDRCNNASNINPRAVSDGSNGMLVSFWISKVPAFA